MHRLESRVAELLGKQASLFLPTGTMANQLAIYLQTRPGEEILVGEDSHLFHYEMGGAALHSGVQSRPVRSQSGWMDPASLTESIRPESPYLSKSSLLCLENTHNLAGGRIISLEHLEALAQIGREHGLGVHLDGARLWNATVASGISLALRERSPGIRIFGVETARDRYTIADGIAVKQPGELTSRILDDVLDGMIDVSDDEISKAIVMLLDRTKLVVEGAGAVGVAALLSGRVEGSGPVLAVLSGGNIDPTMLISVMRHGLTIGGRYLVVRTHLTDRPGELIRLLSLVAEERGNVISVEHHREGMDIPVTATEVELTLLTRDEEHCLAILATMADRGYMVERLS
jgi:hypothetical protein